MYDCAMLMYIVPEYQWLVENGAEKTQLGPLRAAGVEAGLTPASRSPDADFAGNSGSGLEPRAALAMRWITTRLDWLAEKILGRFEPRVTDDAPRQMVAVDPFCGPL